MIKIPADVYDYHELVSEAYGGIGNKQFYLNNDEPCCILGQRDFYAWGGRTSREIQDIYVLEAWFFILYSMFHNDQAISSVSNASGPSTRIPWSEYCKRREIVRGEE